MRKIVAASVAGNALEWYDFFLYGTAAALVFSKLFFRQVQIHLLVLLQLLLASRLVLPLARLVGSSSDILETGWDANMLLCLPFALWVPLPFVSDCYQLMIRLVFGHRHFWCSSAFCRASLRAVSGAVAC